MKPGALVVRLIDPSLGYALVLDIVGSEVEILTATGERKWVFYDAVEAVEPVQDPRDVV